MSSDEARKRVGTPTPNVSFLLSQGLSALSLGGDSLGVGREPRSARTHRVS
jgi:hypothetical protein